MFTTVYNLLQSRLKEGNFGMSTRQKSAFERSKLLLQHVVEKGLQEFAQKWQWLHEARAIIKAHSLLI